MVMPGVSRRIGVLARAGAAAIGFAVPLAMALLAPAHTVHAASLEGQGADFWPRALACLGFGLAIAVPVLVTAWLLERFPGARPMLWVLASGLGGLAGNLALHVHCPITSMAHLLAGHASVGVVLLALLLVAVRRA